MTDDQAAEPTQPTQPKKGKPVEIPMPKVSAIRAAIRKGRSARQAVKQDLTWVD